MICSVCSYLMGEEEAEGNIMECCWACWHSGRYFEKLLSSDDRSRIIPRLRNIKGIVSVQVIHLGFSQFCICAKTKEGKLIIPGEAQMQEISKPELGLEGTLQSIAPMIMPTGSKWGIAVMPYGWCGDTGVLDRERPQIVVTEGEFDDDELVEQIAQMMELNSLMEVK